MNNPPLVSIIIIFLNEERFLSEAVESVLIQTYDKWELFLVDDGSSDGSVSIAQQYAERLPEKIKYLQHGGHANKGMSASRNLGILHANGSYLAFLDADDVWLPQKLERQTAILEAYPEAGMVYGRSLWWHSWTGKTEDCPRDFMYEVGVPIDRVIEAPRMFEPFFLTQSASIPTPTNILVRRETVEELGGFEESFRGMYEDQAFYAKVCLAASIIVSDECWDHYRQHPESISTVAAKNGQDIKARLFFLDWLAGYIESKGFQGTDLWHTLRRVTISYRYPILHLLLKGGQFLMKRIKDLFWRLARLMIPAPLRAWIWAGLHDQAYIPPVGWVRSADLRRLTPFSRDFGYDRGVPIDRYYIEDFLTCYQEDVRGHVLEIADDNYTRQFGGDRVAKSDILHVAAGDPKATIIGDLATADHIPSDTFDCIILTQTLQVVYDVCAVLRTVHRILKPGGVVLITAPGISQISRYDMDRWGYYWSFTSLSLLKLFKEVFPSEHVVTQSYGNVLTATAFLYGMAVEELKRKELEFIDPDYEVIIGVRAMK
jgi:glycosyltransferase involved in cell wall biosynthesis